MMLRIVVVGLALVTAAMAQKVDVLDVHHLPLGDGRVSDHPQVGYVFSCQQRFPANAPGAQVAGPWIHGTTWDLTEKTHVQGEVMWPKAEFRIERVAQRVLTGNGLPVKTPTGTFPVGRDDPAFAIDRNPNSIREQKVSVTLPGMPLEAPTPSCVGMGMIGVALNGVAIFNALDAGGRDAVAHEMQDLCSGHPEMRGQYHYHGPSACLPGESGKEELVGYALDGFGIYSRYDASGRELTDKDLDACHGRVSEVDWDGKRVQMYHYVLTREYPYTLGCYKGTPVVMPRQGPPGGGFGGMRPGMGPPPF